MGESEVDASGEKLLFCLLDRRNRWEEETEERVVLNDTLARETGLTDRGDREMLFSLLRISVSPTDRERPVSPSLARSRWRRQKLISGGPKNSLLLLQTFVAVLVSLTLILSTNSVIQKPRIRHAHCCHAAEPQIRRCYHSFHMWVNRRLDPSKDMSVVIQIEVTSSYGFFGRSFAFPR